jgi:transposase-like protein
MEQGRKERRHFGGPEKVAILRRHLVEKVPVSILCEELHLQPTALYRWLKEFFDNGAAAFAAKAGSGRLREEQRRIEALERKLRRKDEVLSELMEEHITLKKRLGEP